MILGKLKGASIALVCLILAAVTGLCVLTGCASSGTGGTSADIGETASADANSQVVRVGTMPTEDILPLWVAEQENFTTENGMRVEVVTFDSAQALSAAITSGDVDMAMTDIMRAAKLTESGIDTTLEWVTLGETADQGRFGVLAAADAPYNNLQELADYTASEGSGDSQGVGVGSNTVPEYVFDKLCEEAGVDGIPVQEVASLPDRYSLVASGQLLAAALPASMLALGEASGMKVIADDTQGENISQSVMVARTKWSEANAQGVLDVAQIWDAGVSALAANPNQYRALLVEKANLNSAIADTYPISSYPMALHNGELAHPSGDMVQPVLEWMVAKGYGGKVTYDDASGVLEVKAA
ncbi:ABC transporter substrate-binding protein [Adlercreutzia sp. ZJ304]|uniref:ABC transporter substrate-binding protein n=1 Tax=Adlercreutzia sp. ZJ304 TaxID=2709791 RepID=UPI0013ECF547|nr:ABC transporter substrate-binding protein [Adlercreutzia sp. ZJ304]